MKQILAISLFTASLASAQPVLAPPKIGFVLDNANAVRPVFGVTGNFNLGDSFGADAISCGFSGSVGFAKTDSAIVVFDKDGQILYRMDAPPGAALFGFPLIYLTDAKVFLRWTGVTLEPVALSLDGEVLSIAQPDPGHAAAIVRREDGLWLVRLSLESTGIESQSALPGIQGPLLFLADGGFVFSSPEGGLGIRRANGTGIQLRAPRMQSLRPMGDGWVQATDSEGRQLALDVRPGREQIYQLPEAQQ